MTPTADKNAAAAEETKALPVIAAYGDSLLEGWGLPPQDALPAQLEAALGRAGKKVRVLNFGVSGETAP